MSVILGDKYVMSLGWRLVGVDWSWLETCRDVCLMLELCIGFGLRMVLLHCDFMR